MRWRLDWEVSRAAADKRGGGTRQQRAQGQPGQGRRGKNSQVYPQGKLYPRKEKEEKEGKGSEMIKASLLGESTCNYR